jgi:hypothetical protein
VSRVPALALIALFFLVAGCGSGGGWRARAEKSCVNADKRIAALPRATTRPRLLADLTALERIDAALARELETIDPGAGSRDAYAAFVASIERKIETARLGREAVLRRQWGSYRYLESRSRYETLATSIMARQLGLEQCAGLPGRLRPLIGATSR